MIREGIKYIAIPPGETIKEMLEDREMSQKEFAKRMDMSEKHVCHLLNGDVELTNDTALKLEMVLGADAYIWLNLESIYRRDLIKVDLEMKMLKDIKVASKYPSNEIINLNWIEKGSTQNDLVVKIKEVDLDEVKDELLYKAETLKAELASLDKEKVKEIALEQANKIKTKAEELYKLAIEKGTPVVEKATDDVRKQALKVVKEIEKKLNVDKKEK